MGQNWAAVPVLVCDLYVKYAADARTLAEGAPNHQYGWVLETDEIGPVWVKRSEDAPAGVLPTLDKAHGTAQSWMGGPNPLTSMLLTGALTGGLGYGAGYLLNKLFPKSFSKQTPKAFGLLGGLGGAGGSFMMHGAPALKHQGIKGMITRQPLQGGEPYADTAGIDPANYSVKSDMDRMAVGGQRNAGGWKYPDGNQTTQYGAVPKAGASVHLAAVLDRLSEELGVKCVDADFDKHASAGADYLQSIPTDRWGRVVLDDPFLDNPEKAIAAGLPYAAGARRGSNWVSPHDVAGVAMNAGLGYGYGYLGSLAAKFMGMSPNMQKGIQRAGLLAGAIRGITGMA